MTEETKSPEYSIRTVTKIKLEQFCPVGDNDDRERTVSVDMTDVYTNEIFRDKISVSEEYWNKVFKDFKWDCDRGSNAEIALSNAIDLIIKKHYGCDLSYDDVVIKHHNRPLLILSNNGMLKKFGIR